MWQRLGQKIRQWRIVLIPALSTTGIVLLFNFAGSFQLLEWAALDRWFRLRPAEAQDPRIVIVSIDEADITQIAQWPMSDALLADAIAKIAVQNPRVIGLDLYRDLPIEPGHQRLRQIFSTTPQLIGIEKFSGEAVAPPPILKQTDRVGIVDLIVDADGKVRRGLLSVRTPDHPAKLSLGAKLALAYLESEEVTQQLINGKTQQYRLGRSIIDRFEANDGGYVGADAGGYQILLNFRGSPCGASPSCSFEIISLSDVLDEKIPADLLRDRIVLIGVTAPSLGDRFYNPYSYNDATTVTGVEIHAHVVSQLVSAALDGRAPIKMWSDPFEYGWVLIWSVAGGILATQCLEKRRTVASILLLTGVLLLLSGCLIAGTYGAFLAGWWIPVVTTLIAFTGTAIGSTTYLLWSNLKVSYQALESHAHSLERSQRRYSTLAAAAPVGIFRTDAMGHCIYVNERWCQIAGLTLEEAMGQGWQKGIHPSDRTLVTNEWYQSARNHHPFQLEYRFQGSNGQVTWVYGQAVAEENTDGQIVGYVGTITDISDRKQAEADREEFCTQLGHLNRELEQANQQLADYSQTLEQKVEERTADLQVAQERIIAQEKLAALGTLIAGIAHELSNPLNFVKNFAEGSVELSQDLSETLSPILPSLDPESLELAQTLILDLQENAGSIHHHSQRAEQIIASMMLHTHPNSEQVPLETVHLDQLLTQAVKLAAYSKTAQNSHFQLSISTDFDVNLVPIQATPSSLTRAFINFIDNACDAMHLKWLKLQGEARVSYRPTLSISMHQMNQAVEIRIRDNGCGIESNSVDKIFSPFFTTKPPGEGTGLGLSIAYDIIVKQHQGSLAVDTKLDKFTEIILTLPSS